MLTRILSTSLLNISKTTETNPTESDERVSNAWNIQAPLKYFQERIIWKTLAERKNCQHHLSESHLQGNRMNEMKPAPNWDTFRIAYFLQRNLVKRKFAFITITQPTTLVLTDFAILYLKSKSFKAGVQKQFRFNFKPSYRSISQVFDPASIKYNKIRTFQLNVIY